jgi:hypothetical protein
MRISDVDKAFGAIFVDIEGLKFIRSLAYRKGGYLHIYLKGNKFDAEETADEMQKEIDDVFEVLRLSSSDVELKDSHVKEYLFTVLNEKNVKKAFNRVHRNFKRKSQS